MKNKYLVGGVVLFGMLLGIGIWIAKTYKTPQVGNSRTAIKISELPAATSFDASDLFIISDAGITSKKLTGSYLIGMTHDTATRLRFESDTAKDNLRALITSGGDGLWTINGNSVYLTDIYDSVLIGGAGSAGDKLSVIGGDASFREYAGEGGWAEFQNGIRFGTNGTSKIFPAGDDLWFTSTDAGATSLSSLLNSGGAFLDNGTTKYNTINNFHIGSSATTTYKLKVTGDFGVTGNSYIGTLGQTYLGAPNYNVWVDGNLSFRQGGFLNWVYGTTVNISLYGTTSGFTFMDGLNDGAYNRLTLGFQNTTFSTISNGRGIQLLYYAGTTNNTSYMQFLARGVSYTYNGTYFYSNTDTLATRAYARGYGGSAEGGGVIDTVTSHRFTSLIWGDLTNDSVRLNGAVHIKDTTYLDLFKGMDEPWISTASTGALIANTTVPAAWIGLQMALKDPDSYFKDQKLVDGHYECRVYYLEPETGELKYQYGNAGLSARKMASWVQISFEMSLRWHRDAQLKIQKTQRLYFAIGVFILIWLGFITFKMRRK